MAVTRYNDSHLGEILLNQSARCKRLSITVLASGAVRLSYPPRISSKRALEYLREKSEWVIAAKQRVEQRRSQHPPAIESDEIRLRTAARDYLPKRLEEISKITGLKYSRLTIRKTTSKWGSCSSSGSISLSIYLMALPRHLVDFVILHELCHTVHFNHSADFHNLLNRLCGGVEKKLALQLKGYSIK